MNSKRFTKSSEMVMLLAAEHARRIGSNQIDAEHILLGIVDERNSLAAKTLGLLGLTRTAVRLMVEKLFGRGIEVPNKKVSLTEKTIEVLEQSQIIAIADSSQKIEPRHLLMGIIDEGTNRAVEILTIFDVDLVALRQELWTSSEPVGEDMLPIAVHFVRAMREKNSPESPDLPIRKEGDPGSTISCSVKNKQRGGYNVMLANGKDAFLHSELNYNSEDRLEVLVVQVEEHIVVTDKKEAFIEWPPSFKSSA